MYPEAIFIDAAGTLIRVAEPVGGVYAKVAARHGLVVDSQVMEMAFRAAWKSLPPPQHAAPPEDDDRSWWQELVHRAFAEALRAPLAPAALEPLFAELYAHYAQATAWMVFEDVVPALERMLRHSRLFVLSNFDQRLRSILAGHGLDRYFEGMIISSEVGASKPDGRIFRAALDLVKVVPTACLHLGDEPAADVAGASAAGIPALQVKRPETNLLTLAEKLCHS